MVCKNCGTENPEGAVFCMQCGKRLDGKKNCPSCNALCPEEAVFCNACGARIVKEEVDEEAPKAQPQTESKEEPASKEKKTIFEKLKFAFDLSGGICLMTAVLFAFVFVFCMGLTVTVTISSFSSASETAMLWDYFGSEYDDLAKILDLLPEFTSYFEAANYIPLVLTTVICAGTLLSVLSFTIIAAVKYGKHFKNPTVQYAKPAIAAILSFVLGATAFLAVNATSLTDSLKNNVSVSFSDATLAGIILCGLFLGLYFAFKTAALGKEFIKKQSIIEFVCTAAGVVCLTLVAAFAAAPAVSVGVNNKSNTPDMGLGFSNANLIISTVFGVTNSGAMPENFDATYICTVLAQAVQIFLLIFAFIALIEWIGGYQNKKKSHLGDAIALFALAVVYLVLTCVALHFGTKLMEYDENVKLSIAAAPIVAIVFSAFTLAASITHKVLTNKSKVQD